MVILLALVCPAARSFAQGFGGTVTDHLVRGDSLLAQGKTAEAIVQFQEARTLCPTPAEIVSALRGEAQGHLLQNEPLPAVGLLEEAATRFPDDPRASNLLYQAAAAAHKVGEIDKAIDLYRHALDRNPTPDIVPSLKLQLALTLRLKGRQGEAVDVLKDFEKDHPDHPLLPNVLYTTAMAEHDIGTGNHDRAKLEESATVFKELIAKYPGRPAAIEAHFELGLLLQELGRRAESADYFKQYASLNPNSPVTAGAMVKAADLLLFLSPKESAQLYALAQVKAKVNPKPDNPDYGLGRFLSMKQTLAVALSRLWLVVIVGVIILGTMVLLGLVIVRRFRKTPAPVGA